MTIHNFYLVAVCSIWVGILTILYLKVLTDRFRRAVRRWERSRITLVFSPDCPSRKSRRICRSLPRYARDEQLFRYICDCYCAQAQPGSGLTLCLEEIFHKRISTLRKGDTVRRQMLMQTICRTRLSTAKIDRFVQETDPCSFPGSGRLKAAR